MWKKMLDLWTVTCSKNSLPEYPFSISAAPGAAADPVPVLCSLLSCGAQPITDTGDKRGVPWAVLSLQSHWKELGFLQFSLFPLTLLVLPKEAPKPSGERLWWGAGTWVGKEEFCLSLSFWWQKIPLLCLHVPWTLQGTTTAPDAAAEVGKSTTAPRLGLLQKPLNFALPEFSKSCYNAKSTSIK